MGAWMKDKNLDKYWEVKWKDPQSAHKWAHSAFHTFAHHVSGQKYLLHMLVKLPILAQCTTSNLKRTEVPALEKWIEDLQRHKQTPAYKNAVKMSQPAATPNHKSLSREIWDTHRKLSEGKELAEKRDSGDIKWDDLNKTEQDLLEAYDTKKLEKTLRTLVSQKTPPEKRYKGAAASVAEENTDRRWRQKRSWPGWSAQSKNVQLEETDGWSPVKRIKKGSAAPPA